MNLINPSKRSPLRSHIREGEKNKTILEPINSKRINKTFETNQSLEEIPKSIPELD